MTIDLITPEELSKLWAMISEEAHLHSDDSGPKTFEGFAAHLVNENITVFAIRTGKKFVGAVGFAAAQAKLRGIHFIKEVRGSGLPATAVKAVLVALFSSGLEKIHVGYMATNIRVHKFLSRLGAEFRGIDGEIVQSGRVIPMLSAVFHADKIR